MADKKKFVVTISETRCYDFNIEAESPEEAREIALSGNLDFDADSINSQSTDCEVINIELKV